ncbi:MAG: aminotransferase class IV [Bdellovibrionales bacterium]|nr:aminotransferase class IV [Bdellovibrionales bacterium]MBT3526487.1 aminotransferase class IV [Bdellovibrionales bacterium]MBT7670370.1 aminotransferase class IV [Bdellovibrionales bacterium]MBT7766851.1 aminotransferase class IV [Bdellovibrionales bacterium]
MSTRNFDTTFSKYRRGFLYGETVFTSFTTADHSFLYLEQHLERLFLGADYLFSPEAGARRMKKQIISQLIKLKQQNLESDLRFRITIFADSAEDDSLVLKEVPNLDYLITSSKQQSIFQMNPKRSLICDESFPLYPSSHPLYLKLGNYAGAIRLQKSAHQQGVDDVLLFNQRGNIAECTTSNIFFVMNRRIYTPAITCNIFPGIIRGQLILSMRAAGLQVIEDELAPSILRGAQEVFCTNSVQGIVPVVKIGGWEHYQHQLTEHIHRGWVNHCHSGSYLQRLSDLTTRV